MKYLAIFTELTGAPTEFQLLPAGRIDIEGDAPAILDEASAAMIIADFERRGKDMVIDYEHQSLSDGENPAAGWIKRLVWKGKDGLWAVAEWTKRAQQYLEAREYRYFSPVMWLEEKTRAVVQIWNVGLTNTPRINNLKPIVAKYTDITATQKEKEDSMIEKLKKLLGLAADAGEDKVLEAVTLSVNKATTQVACKEVLEALGAKPEAAKEDVVRIVASLKGSTVVACKEVLDALGAKDGAVKEDVLTIVASLKTPSNVTVQLSQDVARLTKELSEMKQTDLITLALKEGKTSPDELDKWGRTLALKDPEQFKLIVLSRPAGSIIPVDGIGNAPKDRKAGGLDDSQRAINAMCGIDDAAFAKYNK